MCFSWRAVLLSAGLLSSAGAAVALDSGLIRPNGEYYYDQWNDNVRVRALSVQGDTVEIVYLEGDERGVIDFVPASTLLTSSQSEEDAQQELVGTIGAGAALGVLALCLMFEDCRNHEEGQQ